MTAQETTADHRERLADIHSLLFDLTAERSAMFRADEGERES